MYLPIHFHSSNPFFKCFTIRVPYDGLCTFRVFQEEVRDLIKYIGVMYSSECQEEKPIYFDLNMFGEAVPNRDHPELRWSPYCTMTHDDWSIQVGATLDDEQRDHCDTDHYTTKYDSTLGLMTELKHILEYQLSKPPKTTEEFLEYNNAYRE